MEFIERNYRPVSKLQFTGKLIEHVVTYQLNDHITWNGLMEPMQSAYRSGHSMETTLLKVHDDMLRALDNQEVMSLVLLDLLVAFDMADHAILLRHLESNVGISDTALAWIRSYLSDHSQKVIVGNMKSDPVTLAFGVPQGSVLAPILFTLHTSTLDQISTRHGITHHFYADDQHIYHAFKVTKKGNQEDCVRRLENCIGKIRMWMSPNMLKLNDGNTEFIIFSTREQLAKVQEIAMTICDIKSEASWILSQPKPSHKPFSFLRLTTATHFSWGLPPTNLTSYSVSKTWHAG